jgi:predicted RNA binding protein YcfA (HicA-like mRNA interferase family)
MPRLPRVSGKDAIRALRRAGLVIFDQKVAPSADK